MKRTTIKTFIKMKRLILVAILLISVCGLKAQNNRGITVFGTIYGSDTIALSYLEPVIINGYIMPLTDKEKKDNAKLIRMVRKTYPISEQVSQLLGSYYKMLDNSQNDSQKDKIKKQAYTDIKNKFEQKIKRLSKDEAKLLTKLIYRQTGNCSYNIIKEFGGGMRANLTKLTTKAMGVNLNETFDSQNNKEDNLIERIIYSLNSSRL